MAPRLVNEILAGMTCRHDLGSTFPARHHVMPAGRNLTLTEDARLNHRFRPKHTESKQHRKWRKKWGSHPRQGKSAAWPSARTFQGGVLVYAGLLPLWRRERDSHSRWGEPHLLSRQAPRLSGPPPQQFKMVGVPGNAPGLGTNLVRFRL